MKLTTKISLGLSLLLTLTISSMNVNAGSYRDTAKIKNVTEVYEDFIISKPYKNCYRQKVVTKNRGGDGSATNELLGGILGGAIGNQFGKGSGKDVATIAGALLGASIANDSELDNNKGDTTRVERVCETRYRDVNGKRLSHYNIKYSYKGRTFNYASNYMLEKGDDLSVRVNVEVE